MITHEEMGLSLPKSDNTVPLMYRYVDAYRRKRRILKAPDRATTLRHVKRLLDSLWRHPEDAERVKLEVERISASTRGRQDTRRAKKVEPPH
jgi:hypothetical protein